MDSPETTLLGPSAAQADVVSPSGVQESPFFTYVSNLSPIKLTNDLRAPSTIRELNFPSPTPVFTSPHVNPVRKEKLLKRPQHLSPDSGKFSLDCVGDIREQLEKASHYGGDTSQSVFAPCSANTVRGQPAIQLQSCSSPSDCIDDFLADPAEDSGNSSAMSNLCLSKIVGLGLPSQKTPTDVTDQCQEGSTSLLILSQQGDKTTDDIKTEAGKNDGPNDIGLLMLESQARENDEASMQLIHISGHDGDLKDASDNGGENKERQSAQNVTSDDSSLHVVQQIDTQTTNYVCSMMPENVEDDSLVNKNEVSILPLDSSIFDGNVDLVERDQSLRVPPNSLDVHPNEEASTSSKPQWGGGQFAYAMRRRLEFVHSSAPSSNPYSGRDSYNLRPESPSSSLDLELEIVSHSYPIGAYASPDTSLYQTNVDSSSHASSQLPVCMEGNLTRSESSVRKRPAGIGLHLNSIGNAPDKNSKLSGQPVDRELVKESSAVPFQMREHCNTDQNVNTLPQPDVYSESAIVGSSIEKVEEDQHKNLDITVMSSLPMETVSQLSAPCSVKRSPGELIDISPKKKSKKAPESGGCKRCNCKKSKCLKLYCDCFAAGVYCTDSCSCQGCLNRLEHEHIVMETRQQIEIRNPLAFAPKVVVHDTAVVSRSYGDAESHTPASARHKRGCNCKKSQCLKKYCECFQSKVGCSLGCRCEGCKNSYGMKDGPASSENEIIRKSWNEKQGRGAYVIADEADAGNEFPRSAKPLHLSPLTPLVDGSDGINPSKSQFLYRKYHSSPESAASRERNNAHDEADIEATDVFSPRWDRIGEIFILSPGATHGAVKVNSQSGPRGSPMTPSLPFGITRFAQESSSDCGPVNAYENDGTPDILLRDNCLPCQGPKVGSPNKKRVSPPHHHCQQDDRTSSSSRSMKSRKFVLQSVPSFPSLTPYSNVAKGQGL